MATENLSLHDKRIMSFLESLSQEEFSLESITNGSNLELLLPPFGIARIEREVQNRFRKYIEKRVVYRGEKYSSEARRNIRDGIRVRAYLDTFLRTALSYLGFTAWGKLAYHSFAHAIIRRLKRPHFREWPRILKEVYDVWVKSKGLDPKAARIVALLVAKLFFQLRFGKFRPPDGISEELYPELEYLYKEALEKRIAEGMEKGMAFNPETSEEPPSGGES